MRNIFKKGLDLYNRSSKIIPGGVQLLTKRPEIFLPDQWPSYYKSAKGCELVTFDDIKLYDFTNSSVGMCPLGYANPIVNKSVTKAINKGNTTTLNSHLEYECAKLLIDTHKWSDMVRFTKSVERQCQLPLGSQELTQIKVKSCFVVIMGGMIGIFQQI